MKHTLQGRRSRVEEETGGGEKEGRRGVGRRRKKEKREGLQWPRERRRGIKRTSRECFHPPCL